MDSQFGVQQQKVGNFIYTDVAAFYDHFHDILLHSSIIITSYEAINENFIHFNVFEITLRVSHSVIDILFVKEVL